MKDREIIFIDKDNIAVYDWTPRGPVITKITFEQWLELVR